MDDKKIIDLYWERSEEAIEQSSAKYGKHLHSISYNILYDKRDSDECVNDTYMHAWHAIPPARPSKLSVFLGRICRNISIDKLKYRTAGKRGKGEAYFVLEELKECVPYTDNVESIAEDMVIKDVINKFLSNLDVEKRKIFLKRYWYLCSVKDIAGELNISESNVKMSLLRMRGQLKNMLLEGGVYL